SPRSQAMRSAPPPHRMDYVRRYVFARPTPCPSGPAALLARCLNRPAPITLAPLAPTAPSCSIRTEPPQPGCRVHAAGTHYRLANEAEPAPLIAENRTQAPPAPSRSGYAGPAGTP